MSMELRAEDDTAPSRSGSCYQDKQLRDKAAREFAAGKVIDYHQARRIKLGYDDLQEKTAKAGQARKKAVSPASAIRACALGAAAALYVTGAVYFSSHFYPGTKISGMDCGLQTEETVTNMAVSQLMNYSLTVSGRNGATDVIRSSDIDLIYKNNGSIEEAMNSQKSFIWPLMIFHPAQNVVIGREYDSSKVSQAIDSMSQMQVTDAIEPQDAYLRENEDGYYEIVPEVMGTTLYSRKVYSAVINSLNLGESTLSLEDAGCYLSPRVLSTDSALIAEMNGKNEVMGAVLTLNIEDEQISIDAGDFLEQDSDGSYGFSEEKVWDYVADLAEQYDTVGTERTFYTSLGTTVDLQNGDYGWKIDQSETAQELLEALKEKKHGTIDTVYTQTAMGSGLNDIGDTYVEISISSQTMWCYKDGYLVVETPVVTGNTSKGNGTPSNGVWSIKDKEENYTLVGTNYRCPVKYWMPFNGGVGIHDLSSRSAYGGSIYMYAGSHGCINTPLAAVQQIFEAVSVGTPVVVYD